MLENKTSHTNFVKQPNNVISGVKYQQQFVIPTYVESHLVEALRDSGSPITILRRDVLQGRTPRYTGKRVALGGLFGNTRTVPMAIIKIHSPKFGLGSPEVSVEVALVDKLQCQMLLGCDMFEQNSLLKDPILTTGDKMFQDQINKKEVILRNCEPLETDLLQNDQPRTEVMVCTRRGAAKFRSSLDLVSAFNQIPLEEESRKYTGFRTDLGFYQYKRMCFGLRNASKTMQKLMNFVLRGAEKFCLTHVDDVIIFHRHGMNTCHIWKMYFRD